MSDETAISDDTNDDGKNERVGAETAEPAAGDEGPRAELRKTKQRLEAEADRAVSEFDEGIVDLLAWLLDTETRARIYVYLRQHPHSTSDEIAEGTGLYPSTVREALADLHDEDALKRRKRDSDGAGNNPYEYEAIAPSSLVRGVVGEVQQELNTVFTLESDDVDATTDDGPVTITIDSPDAESDGATGDDDADAVDTDNSDDDGDDAEREDV